MSSDTDHSSVSSNLPESNISPPPVLEILVGSVDMEIPPQLSESEDNEGKTLSTPIIRISDKQSAKPLFERLLTKFYSRESIGTLFSIFVHLLIIFLLTIWFFSTPYGNSQFGIIAGLEGDESDGELFLDTDYDIQTIGIEKILDISMVDFQFEDSAIGPVFPNTEPVVQADIGTTNIEQVLRPNGSQGRGEPRFSLGGGMEGRNAKTKGDLLKDGIITLGSENAVESGLRWLRAHQDPADGGFHFENKCEICRNSGNHTSRLAATSLAALAFLGAGHTHKQGEHKDVVSKALYFIIRNSTESTEMGLYLRQGSKSMYTQGLAALAICETYAMTKDPDLKYLSEQAVRYIVNSQDPTGGGWRYVPQEQPGDMSVTGWQVMALKSAHLAKIDIPRKTLYGISDFLKVTEQDGGVRYNYLPLDTNLEGRSPDSPKTCTAIGHLLNMYIGASPGYPPLDQGVSHIAGLGPLNSSTHCCLYYAYYGTLVMHHYGGSSWDRWFPRIRNFLVETQSKESHESGSWYFPDENADKGGRLFNTCLAIMILEVPYRYMPLYKAKKSAML